MAERFRVITKCSDSQEGHKKSYYCIFKLQRETGFQLFIQLELGGYNCPAFSDRGDSILKNQR